MNGHVILKSKFHIIVTYNFSIKKIKLILTDKWDVMEKRTHAHLAQLCA